MEEREAILRRWFSMWLEGKDQGLAALFQEDALYIESWGPQYQGVEKIKHWFTEWNTRGRVLRWDMGACFHRAQETMVTWRFHCRMDDGTELLKGSPTSSGAARAESSVCRNLAAMKSDTIPTNRVRRLYSRSRRSFGFNAAV